MSDQLEEPDQSRLVKYLVHQSLPRAITTSGYNPTTRDIMQVEQALVARYGPDLAGVSVREIDSFLHRRFVRLGETPQRRVLRRSWRVLTCKFRKKR